MQSLVQRLRTLKGRYRILEGSAHSLALPLLSGPGWEGLRILLETPGTLGIWLCAELGT